MCAIIFLIIAIAAIILWAMAWLAAIGMVIIFFVTFLKVAFWVCLILGILFYFASKSDDEKQKEDMKGKSYPGLWALTSVSITIPITIVIFIIKVFL